jgi:hypothetical protein
LFKLLSLVETIFFRSDEAEAAHSTQRGSRPTLKERFFPAEPKSHIFRPSKPQPMPERRRVFILQVALITAIIFVMVIVELMHRGVTTSSALANTFRKPAMFLGKIEKSAVRRRCR